MNTDPIGSMDGNSAAPSGNRSASELARAATRQLGDSLTRGKAKLSEFQTVFTQKTQECIHQTQAYVQENPWKALGWAAGIGFALGLILRRR
ncbi:MAG: hypothetical protein L0Z50_26050 [Verrucomicrobiales bacterium]|nr:hypothetical protein [Verrucomicrobiales bacterium]